jgi:serine/threonine-protein kinase
MSDRRPEAADPGQSGARQRTLVSKDQDAQLQTARFEDARAQATLGPVQAVATASEQPPPASSARDRYERRGAIARGGMSHVERVHDRLLRRTAAMKTIVSDEPGAQLRFLEEAQIAAQLDHPNIVPVYDLGVDQHGEVSFFTMKLVEGRTLTQEVCALGDARLSPRNLERLLRAFLKACDAVAFAHSRGVVHRDLKPDNVMLGSHGQLYVMDWGVARLIAGERPSERGPVIVERPMSSTESTGAIVGTPAYMAPEQAQGLVSEADARTDVYGLGGILYFILTERAPRWGTKLVDTYDMALRGEIRPLEAEPGHPLLPPGLKRIALRALSSRPAERHASVEELAREVEELLRGGGWFDVVTALAGTLVVREGGPADCAYIIVEGECEAFKTVEGRRVALRRMSVGEVFGETAVLTGEPRTASVEAVTDTTLAVLTRDSLERELERTGWMSSVVRALARRFADLDAQLTALRRERT